jgi:hypothetical protein
MRKCCAAAWYGRETQWQLNRETCFVKREAQGEKEGVSPLFARYEIRFTNDEYQI